MLIIGVQYAGMAGFSDEIRIVRENDTDFVGETGHAGIPYYDDQQVSPRELAGAIRNIDDRLPDEELFDRTLFVPDGWV